MNRTGVLDSHTLAWEDERDEHDPPAIDPGQPLAAIDPLLDDDVAKLCHGCLRIGLPARSIAGCHVEGSMTSSPPSPGNRAFKQRRASSRP